MVLSYKCLVNVGGRYQIFNAVQRCGFSERSEGESRVSFQGVIIHVDLNTMSGKNILLKYRHCYRFRQVDFRVNVKRELF